MATYELSSLNGFNGFSISGGSAYDQAGLAVSSAGDINGDGLGDIIIGAGRATVNDKAFVGKSYVVFGSTESFDAELELSNLDTSTGLLIEGIDSYDLAGRAISSAGDINGDGLDDVLIGAYRADPNAKSKAGETYVVFGVKDSDQTSLDLSSLNGNNGFVVNGETETDYSGFSVSSAGDVNGDGIDDIIIGARYSDPNGQYDAGSSYVVFGIDTSIDNQNFAGAIELSSLDGTNGFSITGSERADFSGFSVSPAGDINGDGRDDILIGAPGANTNRGETYVIFGKSSDFSASLNLSNLDGTNGFIVAGVSENDKSGTSVSSIGDFNGDGLSDIIIGANGGGGDDKSWAGESYVLFGKNTDATNNSFDQQINLADFETSDGKTGFVLRGASASDESGRSVSSAGDFNADGLDDILIGALKADPGDIDAAGESYLIFGRSQSEAVFDLSSLSSGDKTDGIVFNGIVAGDYSGQSVSSAGDVNGDGFDDIIIGAVYANPGDPERSRAGEGYVVFGYGAIIKNNEGTIVSNSGTNVSEDDTLNADYTTLYDPVGFDGNTVAYQWLRDGLVIEGATSDSYILKQADVNKTITLRYSYTDNAGNPQNSLSGTTANVLNINDSPNKIFSSNLNLASLDGSTGFVINGVDQYDYSGFSVSSAGDINGDGFDDILIGAPYADPNGDSSGESYVVFGKENGFDDSLDLSSLDGSTGFVIDGIDANDFSGVSVSSAGDINGDGFDDILIGASKANPNGTDSGESYVIFGKENGFDDSLDLSSLDGSTGFVINGIDKNDESGRSVSSAGDINGDGFDDILIGAYRADPNGDESGESYVVFGKESGFEDSLDLSSLNGSTGFVINGIDGGDRSGRSVSSAGDINGDSFDDILIGAYRADPNGDESGESYVVFGKESGFEKSFNLSSLNGNTGFVINGIDGGDRSGRSVSSAGDINGDGFDDILIGASKANPNGTDSGASYVVYGKNNDFDAILDLETPNGNLIVWKLHGADQYRNAGHSVSSAGDINGDGFDDILIGAPFNDPNAMNSGESYVVFGGQHSLQAPLTLSLDGSTGTLSLDGSTGFNINGIELGDNSGFSVSTAGDINGDGFDDILIGALWADPNAMNSGESYVVFGRPSGVLIRDQNNTVIRYLTDLQEKDNLSADVSYVLDEDGIDTTTLAYQWLRNDQEIEGATDQTYTLTQGDAGNTIKVRYSYTDNFGANESVTSAATPTISNVNDAPVGELTISGETIEDQLLTADISNVLDEDGIDTTTLAYQWLRNDQEIEGATDQTYTLTQGDVGNAIKVRYSYTDNFGANESVTSAATPTISNVNDAPVGELTISGETIEDQLLTADISNVLDEDGIDTTTLAYQWLRNDQEIEGTTDQTYTLTQGDAGNTIKVRYSYTDNFGANESVTSAATPTISNVNDAPVGELTISGETIEDQLLTADISNVLDEDGIDTTTLAYQWLRNDQEIEGATDQTYTLTQEDVGNTIKVRYSYTDNFGANESVTSAATPTISNVNDDPTIGLASNINLGSLDGSTGFVINGIDKNDESGRSVSSAGDINGDGFDDILIGAYRADPNASNSGESYVVFGKESGFEDSLDLSSLDGSTGFVINGIDGGDRSGRSVSSAGDINGDSFDDILIGAYRADPNASNSGESYVVFGKESGFEKSFNLSSLNGNTGFVINGIDGGDRSGRSVSSAGDINGDGFDDILIGAYRADPNGDESGESYVVFGKESGFEDSLDLSSLDGSTGFVINGIDADDNSGFSVSSAGDINGDSFDDIIIGAYRADPNGDESGESYVVFGKENGFEDSLDLSSLDGSTGFVINGIDGDDESGRSVSSAGDINGDGFDDILIGARLADPSGSNSGESYVLFGKESSFDDSLDLSSLDGSTGFVINGIDGADRSGRFVSSAGDINGDGFDDIIIGAPQADPNGTTSGESYVLFGKESGFEDSLDLSSLDGSTGLVINGVDADDRSGGSVSSAGDINGDGFDDIIISASQADPNGTNSGESYVVFGRPSSILIRDQNSTVIRYLTDLQEKDNLSADVRYVLDEDGIDTTTLAYQWLRNDQEIEGAIDQTYTLTQADVGITIKVRYSYTDNFGANESVTSKELGNAFGQNINISFQNDEANPSSLTELSNQSLIFVTNDTETTTVATAGGTLGALSQNLSFTHVELESESYNDGISLSDAILQLEHIVNLKTLSGNNAITADVNGDGNITLSDAILTLEHIVNLSSISTCSLVDNAGSVVTELSPSTIAELTLVHSGDVNLSATFVDIA